MTRKQMRQILADNCIGESQTGRTKEYCEAELRNDLLEKESRLADLEAEQAFNERHSKDLDNGGALPPLFGAELEKELLTSQFVESSMLTTKTKHQQRGAKMHKQKTNLSIHDKILAKNKKAWPRNAANDRQDAILSRQMAANNKTMAAQIKTCRRLAI